MSTSQEHGNMHDCTAGWGGWWQTREELPRYTSHPGYSGHARAPSLSTDLDISPQCGQSDLSDK